MIFVLFWMKRFYCGTVFSRDVENVGENSELDANSAVNIHEYPFCKFRRLIILIYSLDWSSVRCPTKPLMMFSRKLFSQNFILQKHPLFFAIFGAELFFFQDSSAVNHLTHPKFVEDLRRTKMERQQQRLEERIHRLLMSFGKNSVSSDRMRMTSLFLVGQRYVS